MSNIINGMHYEIMIEVDGDNAERFLEHVSANLPNLNRVPAANQIRWATNYWLDQLASRGYPVDLTALALLRCNTLPEFMAQFKHLIIPLIVDYNLPDTTQTVYPMERYQYG
jgi:hypothetical protein